MCVVIYFAIFKCCQGNIVIIVESYQNSNKGIHVLCLSKHSDICLYVGFIDSNCRFAMLEKLSKKHEMFII